MKQLSVMSQIENIWRLTGLKKVKRSMVYFSIKHVETFHGSTCLIIGQSTKRIERLIICVIRSRNAEEIGLFHIPFTYAS